MLRRQRVLIVEDDADLRRMYRQALTFAGYAVQEAGDGLAALRMIDADPPDGVILDLGLPFVSGHTVRQEIAAQAQTRHIPVIIVTGQSGDHGSLGAACVLQKPVSTDRLLQTVKSCIAAGGTSFTGC
jgi:DNA-binding response OmpR family regulator